MNIILRNEKSLDFKVVEELTREAFWNQYTLGCDEHYLVHIMRKATSFIPKLDLVAEVDGEIVGNIVYTKANIVDESGKSHQVLSFGPLAVLPAFQRKGIGGMLIEHTKKIAKELGYIGILIYGDPDYYSKFGFVPAETYQIGTSDNYYAVALQAFEIIDNAFASISGRFIEDAIYDLDQQAVKEFDKNFPSKEVESDTPSQKRFQQLLTMRSERG